MKGICGVDEATDAGGTVYVPQILCTAVHYQELINATLEYKRTVSYQERRLHIYQEIATIDGDFTPDKSVA